MIQILNLCLTGLLTVYAVYRQKQYDDAKASVMGTGFFSIAFYLDCIFCMIMRKVAVSYYPFLTDWGGTVADSGGAWVDTEMLFQLIGILISKSIVMIGLTAWTVIRQNFAGKNTDESGRQPGREAKSVGKIRHVGWKGLTKKTGQMQKDWQYLDGLTMGIGIFFVMLALECMESGRDDFLVALRLFLLLLLLVGYYISIFFYWKKMHHRERMAEIEMQKGEANLYLRNVEDQYQRTRELWHDLKNHISLLGLLLQEEKYEELADYLRIFGEDVDSLTLPVKSGNLVVDALLADKAAKAKKEDIPMELSLCDLTGLTLKPDEICSLLGNLLDNALEANRQVPEGRFLSVECRERADCYYIKVRNAVVDTGVVEPGTMRGREGDMLASRKTDRRNQVGHGLGLRSMERIVHACGGELAVERTENRFTVVVRLPRAVVR